MHENHADDKGRAARGKEVENATPDLHPTGGSGWYGCLPDHPAENTEPAADASGFAPSPIVTHGPQTIRRMDDRVERELLDLLATVIDVDLSNVGARVTDGHVCLTGEVASKDAMRLAEECAASVLGVMSVRNDLHIRKAEDDLSAI